MKRKYCIECGKETDGHLSISGRCFECVSEHQDVNLDGISPRFPSGSPRNVIRSLENRCQMMEKRGPYYEKWLKGKEERERRQEEKLRQAMEKSNTRKWTRRWK